MNEDVAASIQSAIANLADGFEGFRSQWSELTGDRPFGVRLAYALGSGDAGAKLLDDFRRLDEDGRAMLATLAEFRRQVEEETREVEARLRSRGKT